MTAGQGNERGRKMSDNFMIGFTVSFVVCSVAWIVYFVVTEIRDRRGR